MAAFVYAFVPAQIFQLEVVIVHRKQMAWQRLGWLVNSVVCLGIALLPVAVHYFGGQLDANSNYLDPLAITATLAS